MDRGMEMGQDGEPSGAAPLRDASRHKCEGCGVETDLITPYCLICQVEGEIKSFLTDSEVGEARKRVRAALEAAPAAPEPAPGEGSPSELDALRTELEEEKTARMSAERALDDWLEVHKEFAAAWKASGPDPFAHPSGPSQDSQEVAKIIDNLIGAMDAWGSWEDGIPAEFAPAIADARRLSAILSQSPKGAAGAGRECWVKFDKDGHARQMEPYLGHWHKAKEWTRMIEAAAPSPTTAGGGACGTCGGSRKVDSGGQDGAGNWIERDCPECMSGEPSAPKTGLRGAARRYAEEGITESTKPEVKQEVCELYGMWLDGRITAAVLANKSYLAGYLKRHMEGIGGAA